MIHETPTNEIFDEMKTSAIKIWQTYDNEFGYVDEKLQRINSIQNFKDNAMVFYRMFDHSNQSKMRINLSTDAINYIHNNL